MTREGGNDRKTKVGILGAGSVVKDFHLSVLFAMPEVEIAWLCDKVESQARTLAQLHAPHPEVFTHIEDCPDVDIVLVAIPVGVRRAPLAHIFERGWNALCEKPFAVSLAEHDAILKQASENGVQVAVGLQRRYYRGNMLARQLLRSGVLGEIKEVGASEGARMTRTGRRDWYQGDRTAAGGGILLETGAHLVDQLFTVLSVSDFTIQDCRQRTINGLDVETEAVGTLAMSSKSEITFKLVLSNVRDLYSGVDIRFSSCILKLDTAMTSPSLCDLSGQPFAHLDGKEGAVSAYQALCLEWRDFIRQCHKPGGHKAAISADTARQSTAFIDQCYQLSASAEFQPPLRVSRTRSQ